jgi:hypothetical protein
VIPATYTEQPTAVPTLTGPPKIIQAVPVPNPIEGSQAKVWLKISGLAQICEVTVYTQSLTRVDKKTLPLGPGAKHWLLLDAASWPKGCLFLKLQVVGPDGSDAKVVKAFKK